MPVIAVSRWHINQEDAAQIMRDMAPLLKQHGASAVRLGRIHSGEHVGQILAAITFPDGEAYGRAIDTQSKDTGYKKLISTALEKGRILDRTVILAEDF